MTLAQTVEPRAHRRVATKRHGKAVLRDASVASLIEVAEHLDGRALPGVRVTEQEFLQHYWREDLNAEWVDGQVFVMAPASGEHCDINGWLFRLMADFVEHGDLGIVRGVEFQIRLTHNRSRRNPDILFVAKARLSKLHPNHLEGAPDLAVEIVSPDSESRDWREKYLEYQAAGVREYWIIDPLSERIEMYVLGRSKHYVRLVPDSEDRIHSKVLRGLYIRPAWLWQLPLPKLSGVLKELGLR